MAGTKKGGAMWYSIALLDGAVAAALLAGWWVRRHQRDIDAYEHRDFRAPLVFGWPPVG
jgi:hypothetical protein